MKGPNDTPIQDLDKRFFKLVVHSLELQKSDIERRLRSLNKMPIYFPYMAELFDLNCEYQRYYNEFILGSGRLYSEWRSDYLKAVRDLMWKIRQFEFENGVKGGEKK